MRSHGIPCLASQTAAEGSVVGETVSVVLVVPTPVRESSDFQREYNCNESTARASGATEPCRCARITLTRQTHRPPSEQ